MKVYLGYFSGAAIAIGASLLIAPNPTGVQGIAIIAMIGGCCGIGAILGIMADRICLLIGKQQS